MTSEIFGRSGMVVSGHPLASLAGWETLQAGGSVADAAIAAAAVLAVVLPQACSLGGDAFVLYHATDGGTVGLNGSGPSPVAATAERYAAGIPQRGALSITIPGVAGAWAALHDRFGRLPWRSLFDRAIACAGEGFPVSPGLAQAIRAYRDLLTHDASSRALFLPQGDPLAAGTVLRQEALAATLESLARHGAAVIYGGNVPARVCQAVGALGGLLQPSDFASYAPVWVTPIEIPYRDVLVRVMPPNSYGLYMLLQLAGLSGVSLEGFAVDDPRRFAALIRAARAAFKEGDRCVADPDHDPVPVGEVLSEPAIDRLRGAVADGGPGAAPPNRGGTAVVSVADAQGNGITLVQSVFLVFGSGVLDPATGILLNNRMIGFTTEPGHPNRVGGGKRPAHTLNPVMAFRGGKLKYLLGTPGGPGQTITLTQVLSNLVDLRLGPRDAVHGLRWSLDLAGEAIIEAGGPASLFPELARAGLKVTPGPSGSPYFGSAEIIEIMENGVLCGVADHRREAFALGR